LTPYLPQLKVRKEKNLLSGSQDGEAEVSEVSESNSSSLLSNILNYS
jgi:hypothetical protein